MRKFLFLSITSLLLSTSSVYAASPTPGPFEIGEKFGFGHIHSLAEGTDQLVKPIFSIAAFLVLLYFLLGAFKYLRAGGSKEEVDAARQMIIHAIVGFFLLMLSFLILQFILSRLLETKENFQIIQP